ncbi:putative NADP-dependent oxidoreductase YfmJ [Yarrowia sp. B02]|nr:putative NADP-dependent oxidoreductase YfmJ [Yarrowia sp. B02]
MSSYTRVLLQQHPKTTIEASDFKPETLPIPSKSDLGEGEFLIKVKLVSLDPTLRGQMSGRSSYVEAVKLGDPMRAWGIGEVVESKNSDFTVGELVTGIVNFSEYTVGSGKDYRKIPNIPGVPLEDNLGVLGLTGLTAWWGINEIAGGIKSGETVLVSGAAGATGSVAGQLAKIAGAKVIGIAGGKDKCDFITKELGFDVAIDYKSPDFKKQFEEATKDGFDVYYDNVGGEILDMSINAASPFARFVMCGGISQYNLDKPQPLYNVQKVTSKRIKMWGFIVLDHFDRFPEMIKDLATLLGTGKLKGKTHLIEGPVTGLPEALKSLFEGANTGKMVYKLTN